MQVPVVDAHDLCTQAQRAGNLVLIDDFREHVQAQFVGKRRQSCVLVIVEHREHQQDRVGTVIARSIELHGVDNEVLAQHRKVRRHGDGC